VTGVPLRQRMRPPPPAEMVFDVPMPVVRWSLPTPAWLSPAALIVLLAIVADILYVEIGKNARPYRFGKLAKAI
jgi:hypothetical protein